MPTKAELQTELAAAHEYIKQLESERDATVATLERLTTNIQENLEPELDKLETNVRILINQNNQNYEALRIGQTAKKHGIDLWHAHHTTQRKGASEEQKVPLICVAGDSPFAVDFFLNGEDGEVVGIAVTREDKCVGMYGLIPSEYVLDEMEYQNEYGRTL